MTYRDPSAAAAARATLTRLADQADARSVAGDYPAIPRRSALRDLPFPVAESRDHPVDERRDMTAILHVDIATGPWPADDVTLLRRAVRTVHPFFDTHAFATGLRLELSSSRLAKPTGYLLLAIVEVLPLAHALHPITAVTYGRAPSVRTR